MEARVTDISSVVFRARAAQHQLSPRIAALIRDCEAEKLLRPAAERQQKCSVRGKFIYLGEKKLHLKSVAINGPESDYACLNQLGANAVWLNNPTPERLQYFAQLGLKVIARFDLEAACQSNFAGQKDAFKKFVASLRSNVESIKSNPSLIAYDLGSFTSETLLRFIGDKKLIESIRKTYELVQKLDGKRPITCTLNSKFQQLDISFLDFLSYRFDKCSGSDFRIGVARLQNKAGEQPLVVHTNGTGSGYTKDEEQAHLNSQQLHLAFYAGCAGVCLENWSDSSDSEGMLDAAGKQKPAFSAAKAAFKDCPFPPYLTYPRISVVICAYNGEEWIEECLDGCSKLDYPNYEVILINDGSRDHTLELAEPKAKKYGFKIVNQIPNAGLSAARNLGMETASGEIIAYLDQDAFPDEHWLRYLAITFLSTQAAIVGGPNINPLSCGPLSDCVDQAPGNSQIVMIDDELADHVPGCNLSVRRSFMQSIGGFDQRYSFGGDDVNFCWKVIAAGGRLASSPGAMIWHYRRKSPKTFLRQQRGYGKGEAALEKDWPERFNSLGHQVLRRKPGAAPSKGNECQFSGSAIYQTMNGSCSFFKLWLTHGPGMPEWCIFLATLAALTLLGLVSRPFLLFAPILIAATSMWIWKALCAGLRAKLRFPSLKSRLILAYLHLAQPMARLLGRLESGMTPWRSRCHSGFIFPRREIISLSVDASLREKSCKAMLERAIRKSLMPAIEGHDQCDWDWQIDGGIFGGVRLRLNRNGSEIVLRMDPFVGTIAWAQISLLVVTLILSCISQTWILTYIFTMLILATAYASLRQAGEACAATVTLLDGKCFETRSIWENFNPPRHLYDQPLVSIATPQAIERGTKNEV